MVTTRWRAKQESAQDPGPDPSADALQEPAQPADAAPAEQPKKVPWYLWTAPEENFEPHPDEDDVPAPIEFFLLPAAIAFFLIWNIIAGKPVWPPVCDFEC